MPKRYNDQIQRQAILVLGMHRSGTSALGGVLVRLGAIAPVTLMPPTPDNPRGYWESSILMQVNDEILESGGSRWDDWESFNASWIETPTGKRLSSRIPEALEAEFGAAPLFLVKDPRICRLLPVWLHAFKEMRIAPKAVLPFRHPAEVVRSLTKRDGVTQGQAQLIWLRHVLDAEAGSRGLPRVFVHYPDLIADWRAQVGRISTMLGINWPRWSGVAQAEIEDYLSSDLRHHQADENDLAETTQVQTWVARVYRGLLKLARSDASADVTSDFDAVRAECGPLVSASAPLVRELQADFDRRFEIVSMQAKKAGLENDELASKLDLSRQECIANYNLAMDFKSKMEDARNQYQDRENQHASLRVALDSARAKNAEDAAAYAANLAELRRAHAAELSELKQEISGERAAMHEQASISRLAYESEMADVAEKLHAQIRVLKSEKQRIDELAQERTSEIVVLSRQLLELQAAKSELEEALCDVRCRHDEQVAQHARVVAGHKRISAEVAARIATEKALRREMAEISMMLGERNGVLGQLQSTLAWRVARRLPGTPRIALIEGVDHGLEPSEQLAKSNLFDAEWYLQRYPDVQHRGMNPVRHYLQYGAKEGRDPGPAFSTLGYVTRYADVVSAGMNPLLHYLLHGRVEGRLIAPRETTNEASNRTS